MLKIRLSNPLCDSVGSQTDILSRTMISLNKSLSRESYIRLLKFFITDSIEKTSGKGKEGDI